MSILGKYFVSASVQPGVAVEKELLYIEKNSLEDWEVEHVLEWLGYIKLPEEVLETITKTVNDEEIDGMTLEDLNSMGKVKKTFQNIEKQHQKKIWSLLRDVKKKGKFNKRWTLVFCKYYQLCIAKEEPAIGQSMEYSDRIMDKKVFYDFYFSFFVEFFELNDLRQVIKELLKNKKKLKAKSLERKAKEMESVALRKLSEMSGDEMDVRQMHYIAKSCGIIKPKYKKSEKACNPKDEQYKLPCKIVVTEIFDESDSIQKKFRYAVSPVLSLINFKSIKFGLFHTAITIGPWYLEWTTHELVVPKKSFFSAKAIVSMDVQVCQDLTVKRIKDIAMKICNVCHNWNTTMEYGKTRSAHKGNCQDFVDDLLDDLGIDSEQIFKGQFGRFITRMRKHGKCELRYKPCQELVKAADLKSAKIEFDTHKKLDEFVKKVKDSVSDFQVNFADEYQLLKAFDRAFWLRHIHNVENVTFKPLMNDSDYNDCPFGDPRKTLSYIC